MSKRLRRILDISALVCLLGWLAAATALVGFDAADPPRPTVFPAHPTPQNWLGLPGSAAARTLLDLFGVAVVAFMAAWLLLGLTLAFEGRRGQWSWRLLGGAAMVPSLALLADFSHNTPGQVLGRGPGGALGTALHRLLATELSTAGILLVGLGVFVGGLILAGDVFWPRVFSAAGRGLRGIGRALHRRWQVYRADVARRRLLARQRHALPASTHEPEASASAPKAIPIRRADSPATHAVKNVLPRTADGRFELPPFNLLKNPQPFPYQLHEGKLRERGSLLEKTFAEFGLNVRVVGINTGPVITQYEVALETGLRLQKVTRLADDIALKLKVPSVRMVAPIPGKDTVGVEIPNEHRAVVCLKEVILNSPEQVARQKIPLFLGKDTEGRPLVYDLAEMPHLLIAGRTGTGKSVCMNAIILSMLMTRRPDQVQMIMIDPKMLEMSEYGKIPHLMHPVVKDMKKAEAILAWAVDKMEERYDLLCRARVRNIAAYNELGHAEIIRRVNPSDEHERRALPPQMPYIVIFIDEMNDLMMTMRKEVEGHVIRLAQKSRAAGIHLIVATQKPTVDVLTGLIKSNLPARICFQVSSRTDSRVVLDEMGAERLLGKGDLLFLQPGTSTIIRAQGTYASDEEITRVVEFLECEPNFERELIELNVSGREGRPSDGGDFSSRDELYEQAVEIVVREGRGSVSLLQRALGIGYGRAARLIDFMAEDGVVGPYNGSNAREVLLLPEDWRARRRLRSEDAA